MPPREGDGELGLGFAATLEVRAVSDAYSAVRAAMGVPGEVLDVADEPRTLRVLARLVQVLNGQLDAPRHMAVNGGRFGEEVISGAMRLVYSGARDRLIMAREMTPGLRRPVVIALAAWAADCAAAVFGALAPEMLAALPAYPDVADLIGTVTSRQIQDEVERFFHA